MVLFIGCFVNETVNMEIYSFSRCLFSGSEKIMSEKLVGASAMKSKGIIISLIIGLVMGAGTIYIAFPAPDVSGFEDRITELESQETDLQTQVTELQAEDPRVREYYLGGERSEEPQFYYIESLIVAYGENGTRTGVDMYNVSLMVEPGDKAAEEGDKYTIVEVEIQIGDGPKITVPPLEGWSYDFIMQSLDDDYLDELGQLWGIPHSRFEGLTDSNGEVLDPFVAYQVYNSFILYHGYVDGTINEAGDGKGIAELRRIGQKIVQKDSSFQEAPIDFGEQFSEGSIFTSGEVTLEFKGISIVDDSLVAIVGSDEGECSFTMLFEPFPGFVLRTDGGTLIQGDMYVDLASNWVTKVLITYRDVTVTLMGGEKIASGVFGTTVTIKGVGLDKAS
jgi:hypothetical protein